MGSRVDLDDELTVLVTGFEPFRAAYPVNPSWEIARSLPLHLPPLRVKDSSARAAAANRRPVRILTHPNPIRVSYRTVRAIVPRFWDGPYMGHEVDVVLHIGMAGARPQYEIERRGHRQGYKSPDVDGLMLEDEAEGGHGEDWIWHGLPDELEADLHMPDIYHRWRGYSPPDLDLRLSDDAGHYLCDFIYYSSLAHLYKAHRPRKVLFLHVPADASPAAVARGRDLALNLIRSIVESEVADPADRSNGLHSGLSNRGEGNGGDGEDQGAEKGM